MAASDSTPGGSRPGRSGRSGEGKTPVTGDPSGPRRSVPLPPPPRKEPPASEAATPPGPPTAGPTAGPSAGPARGARPHARRRSGPGEFLQRFGGRTTLRALRARVLPRTALGISAVILAFSLGASLAGVVLYSYYEYRLTQTQDKVASLSGNISQTAKKASDELKAEETKAQNLISQQIQPLKSILATGETLQGIVAKSAPALYFVHTLDAAGQPSVGTAFAVASDTRQTLLLTSYNVVQAATRKPGPPLYVRHGSTDQQVTVYTWQESKDLALIILPIGNQPKLTFASASPQPGERVFAVSGLGAQGASVTQGFVADVSADGIQHNATTGTQFQGGPLVDSDGKVVGILSRTYSPVGFPVADVWFAIPPKGACEKVLQCPNGTPAGSTGSAGTQ